MAENPIIAGIQAEIERLAKELEQIEANRKQKKAELRQHRKALVALAGTSRKKKETS